MTKKNKEIEVDTYANEELEISIKKLEQEYLKNPSLSNWNALNNKRYKNEKELTRDLKENKIKIFKYEKVIGL
jgi:hypothetical protein